MQSKPKSIRQSRSDMADTGAVTAAIAKITPQRIYLLRAAVGLPSSTRSFMKISILGASSSGKTVLAAALERHYQALGRTSAIVPDLRHEWSGRTGRTPRVDELRGLAQAQRHCIQEAAPVDLLIADTTPLATAIDSEILFGDRSIYDFALAHQRSHDLTLLTGLDLPAPANALRAREQTDALLRAALGRAGIAYQVIYGLGSVRWQNALNALNALLPSGKPGLAPAADTPEVNRLDNTKWVWACDTCSDPQCERRLLSDLLTKRAG